MRRHLKSCAFLLLCAFAQLSMIESAEAVKMPTALVHTWYSFDQPDPFSNLDIFVRWVNDPTVTPSVGVYAGFGFWFQNGVIGYFGTQVDSGGKKAIFSIWDVGTTGITALPTGNCNRFGHEGKGTQCIISYGWVMGHEYRLRLSHTGRVNSMEQWQATILDTTTSIETSIGVIALSDSGGYPGYGQVNANAKFVNWLEYYGHGDIREPLKIHFFGSDFSFQNFRRNFSSRSSHPLKLSRFQALFPSNFRRFSQHFPTAVAPILSSSHRALTTAPNASCCTPSSSSRFSLGHGAVL